MQELQLEDEGSFYNYLRMEPAMFDELLQRVGPRIAKQNTNWRASLEPGLKLAVTLRFLATGDKYPTLQYQYRVSHGGSRVAVVAEWRHSGRHSHRSMHTIGRPKEAQGRQKPRPD